MYNFYWFNCCNPESPISRAFIVHHGIPLKPNISHVSELYAADSVHSTCTVKRESTDPVWKRWVLYADSLQVHSGWMKRDLESDTCALADKYISKERECFPPTTLALTSRIDGTAGEKLESWLSRLCIQGRFITCVVLFRNTIRLISLGTRFLFLSPLWNASLSLGEGGVAFQCSSVPVKKAWPPPPLQNLLFFSHHNLTFIARHQIKTTPNLYTNCISITALRGVQDEPLSIQQ